MVLILMPVLMVVDVSMEVMTEVFMPVLLNLVGWRLVGQKSLDVVMLNAVLGLVLNVVEQLVVLVLDVFHELLAVMVFNVMLILVVAIWVVKLMVTKITLPVGMVPVSVVSEQRVMDGVVGGEVRIVLDAVNVVVLIVPWLELMGVSVVVVSSVAVLTDVVMSVPDVVSVGAVVRSLVVHGWLVDGVTVCIAMGDFMGRKSVAVVIAVSCMVGVLVDWVVDLSSVLVCSNLVGHVKDVVRQLVIDMPVVVVIVVNDMSLNSLMVILSAIVILVWNIMELSMLMVGLVSMGCMVIIMLSMVCFTVMGVGVVLVIESSLVPIVVPVVLSISMMLVVVIASLVSVDVSWTVLVVMAARVAVMVSLCKDLVEAVGSVAPSLSVAGVRAVSIVVALISPVVDVVLSL